MGEYGVTVGEVGVETTYPFYVSTIYFAVLVIYLFNIM